MKKKRKISTEEIEKIKDSDESDVTSKSIEAFLQAKEQLRLNARQKEKYARIEFNLKLREYFKSRLIKDYANIVLASFLAMIAYDYFIANTTSNGITPSGLGAIARGMAINIWRDDTSLQTSMYWVFYLIINIPLFIFGLIKVGSKFSIRTIVYIALQNAFHYMFFKIPYINPQEFYFIVNYENLILYQNSGGMYQIWLFVFAAIAGVLNGVSFGLLYKGGSSSGGTDFVLAYYSLKHHKSIANYNRVVNYFIVLLMLFIHVVLINSKELTAVYFGYNWQENYDAIIKNNNGLNPNNFDPVNGFMGGTLIIYKIRFFFGPVLFATYLYIIVLSMVTDVIFPKFKYRSLMIVTDKPDKIIGGLQYIRYRNDILRIPVRDNLLGEYSDKELIIISSSMIEYKYVKAAIMVSDPNAKILSYKLDRIIGNFAIAKY